MGMIELVFVACLIAEPATCQRKAISVQKRPVAGHLHAFRAELLGALGGDASEMAYSRMGLPAETAGKSRRTPSG